MGLRELGGTCDTPDQELAETKPVNLRSASSLYVQEWHEVEIKVVLKRKDGNSVTSAGVSIMHKNDSVMRDGVSIRQRFPGHRGEEFPAIP